jgi:hypothetical protein
MSVSTVNTNISSFGFFIYTVAFRKVMSKGEAVPLQTWTGPEGSRRLRLPDFKTIGI